jgi:hypothetical protein
VENKTRRALISVEVLNTSVLLSASSTTGSDPVNNESSAEGGNVSKGVLLAGFLIILKLSIQSLVINLHKNKLPSHAAIATGTGAGGAEMMPGGGSLDDQEIKRPAVTDLVMPILSSSNHDHFISACVLIDIPPEGNQDEASSKAAVDVQVTLSALDVMIKKDLIALLVEPTVRAYLAQTSYCLRKMLISLGVLLDESLILEHSLDCLGVPSVMLRNLRAKMTTQPTASSGGGGGGAALWTLEMDGDPSGSMDRHKEAVTSYLNTSRYYKLLCALLPKGVLSLALHLSAIQADLLSQTSMKTFLIISMQDLFDRALSDPNSPATAAPGGGARGNALNAFLKQATKKTVRKSTKIGQRMSNSMFSGKQLQAGGGGNKTSSAMASLEPISIEIKKATDPIPLITVSCSVGLNVSLPVDDDTICRGLALLMSSVLPFYSIRTVPPPEVAPHSPDDEVEDEEENAEELQQAGEAGVEEAERVRREGTEATGSPAQPPNDPLEDSSGYGLLLESKLPPQASRCPLNTWRVCDFSSFEVRVDNGLFKKEKRPSARPLYNPLCVYGFRYLPPVLPPSPPHPPCPPRRVDRQIPHIASLMPTLPEMIHRGAVEEIIARGIFIPPIFVLHIHIPAPHVMHLKRDGPGTAFVIYFSLSKVPSSSPPLPWQLSHPQVCRAP